MPLHNLSDNHYPQDEMEKVYDLLKQVNAILEPRFGNLNEEERQRFGSIGEENKLIVNKVKDYFESDPELSCDEINWKEFMADYADRAFLQGVINRMTSIMSGADKTRIMHDFDNYKASLRDYEYAQYKNNGQNPRFETKIKELKQFFNRSGTAGSGNVSEKTD